MIRAIGSIITTCSCSCFPCVNQQQDKADIIKAVSFELTTKLPFPTQKPTTLYQQQPANEDSVALASPAQVDPDTTLTAIEASVAQDEDQHQDGQHKTNRVVSAPPTLQLRIQKTPLPDFSLTEQSRLSYWGPSPFSPPNQPLPSIPAQARLPRQGPGRSRSLSLSDNTNREHTTPILKYMRTSLQPNDTARHFP